MSIVGRLGSWARSFRGKQGALSKAEREKLALVVSLLNEKDQPNLNALSLAVRNIDLISLNIKALGYKLARDLGESLPKNSVTVVRNVGLGWKPSVQEDMESGWVAHWCNELCTPLIYHRKLWELAYVLQALHDANLLRFGTRGVGFGCGSEPLASYFASKGMEVLVTDLHPDHSFALGWQATQQHASSLNEAFHSHLVEREQFDLLVKHRAVDMNDIPSDLRGFDFCWSVCAMEHLGSIEKGLGFVESALATLRPGGTAVHTTEFNINSCGPTIDNWPTVLFQQNHLETLAQRLRSEGHIVGLLDFNTGNKPMDQFIDLPPWHDGTWEKISRGLGEPAHMKVSVDGFASTCYGLIITKK